MRSNVDLNEAQMGRKLKERGRAGEREMKTLKILTVNGI